MTNETEATEIKTETKAQPAYRIFSVTKNGDDKSHWFEIGAAWEHSDHLGYSLQFKATALPGAQIVLRAPKAKKPNAQA